MRFMALLRKELRESLPWILSACIILLSVGTLISKVFIFSGMEEWRFGDMKPGEVVNSYQLTAHSILNNINIWLICISVGLGLVLAVRHFGLPSLSHTWPFMIHRSASRLLIITAKLTAAAIALFVCVGFIWTIFFKSISQPGKLIAPPPLRLFVDGWIFITLGAVMYLGASLTVLSTSRWQATRIFGLTLAALVVILCSIVSTRPEAYFLIIASVVVMLSQILYTFLTREF